MKNRHLLLRLTAISIFICSCSKSTNTTHTGLSLDYFLILGGGLIVALAIKCFPRIISDDFSLSLKNIGHWPVLLGIISLMIYSAVIGSSVQILATFIWNQTNVNIVGNLFVVLVFAIKTFGNGLSGALVWREASRNKSGHVILTALIIVLFLLLFNTTFYYSLTSLTAGSVAYGLLPIVLVFPMFILGARYWQFSKQTIASAANDPAISNAIASNCLDRSGSREMQQPEKIGGWLLLPAIGLITGDISSVIGSVLSLLNAHELIDIDLFYEFGSTAFLIYTSVLFFRRKCNAPTAVILVQLLVLSVVMRKQDLVLFLLDLFPMIIWVPYFLVSKRVKKTFLRP